MYTRFVQKLVVIIACEVQNVGLVLQIVLQSKWIICPVHTYALYIPRLSVPQYVSLMIYFPLCFINVVQIDADNAI